MPTTQYTQRYGIYRTTVFNDVLPILKYISMNAEAQLKFPTMKVLKAIAKKLLLNIHQALCLAFNLTEDWAFKNNFFTQNSKEIRDIIFYRRPQSGYQQILLFLLMKTAAIKMSLNQNFRIYTAELESTLPNFRNILAAFNEQFPIQQPSLKQINSIYKNVLQSYDLADYEDIVDNVMHLCPTYRLGAQQEDVNSCANTFTNKKEFSTYNTNANTIKQIKNTFQYRKFQLLSQKSELDRPILEQDEFTQGNGFFKFDFEDASNPYFFEI